MFVYPHTPPRVKLKIRRKSNPPRIASQKPQKKQPSPPRVASQKPQKKQPTPIRMSSQNPQKKQPTPNPHGNQQAAKQRYGGSPASSGDAMKPAGRNCVTAKVCGWANGCHSRHGHRRCPIITLCQTPNTPIISYIDLAISSYMKISGTIFTYNRITLPDIFDAHHSTIIITPCLAFDGKLRPTASIFHLRS